METYLPAVDAGERLHRGAPPLGTEVRERLGVVARPDSGVGERLGGHDRPLPSPAVEPDLVHVTIMLARRPYIIRGEFS